MSAFSSDHSITCSISMRNARGASPSSWRSTRLGRMSAAAAWLKLRVRSRHLDDAIIL